jgi:glycosyltransferase involved in cell wall biosynthesis
MPKPNISFFCPAYYDEKNLPRLIPEVVNLLSEVAEQYEIIIIEDGSPDDTGKVADELAKQFPNVRVIHHLQNLGYGATLAEGWKAGKYDWVFTTDGDRQYDVNEFKTFLNYLDQADAVVGFRRNREISFLRKIQSNTYNWLVSALLGLRFKDLNCSFKAVRKSFLDRINFQAKSAFSDAELLLKLKQLDAKIIELPVTHYRRLHGKASGANFKVIFSTVKDLLRALARP